MSKELKIKHAIIFTLVLVIFIGCGISIYLIQSENQDLKTNQDATIKVTDTKTEECVCLKTECSEEEVVIAEKKYNKLSGLFALYTVEYPLGWHVIDSGLEYFDQDEINTVYVHLNNQPITQVPRGGQPGVIALIDQSGEIPTLEKFLTEKKSLFQNLTEETITNDSGIIAYKLSGQTNQFEQWVEDVVYILEYTDYAGERHLLYTSLQTNFTDNELAQSDLAVLEHIIKSFTINQE